MRFTTILTILSLVVFLGVGAIKAPNLVQDLKKVEDTKNRNKELKKQVAEISSRVSEYSDNSEYFNNNVEIAKVAGKLSGGKLQKISAVTQKDGREFVCAEVKSVSDVQFFSNDTNTIIFRYKLVNPTRFIQSLQKSALIFRNYTIDLRNMVATLTVNSTSYSDDQLNTSESTGEYAINALSEAWR